MELTARDVMSTEFDTIHMDAPIIDAVKLTFKGKLRSTGHRTMSVMVLDDYERLVGTISMYSILFNFRPNFLNYGYTSYSEWVGELTPYKKHFEQMTVAQAMNKEFLTISPDEHIIAIIDHMVKRNLRRLPVTNNSRLLGIVFLPDVYYHLFKDWI